MRSKSRQSCLGSPLLVGQIQRKEWYCRSPVAPERSYERVMLAARIFDSDSVLKFAKLSGDINPIHTNAIASRRTYAGAPIVHGMHLLLWLLDEVAQTSAATESLQALEVHFRNVVYVGEHVYARRIKSRDKLLRHRLRVGEAIVADIAVTFGMPGLPRIVLDRQSTAIDVERPRDLNLDQISGLSGTVSTSVDADALREMFGAAVAWLGLETAATLARSSYLVGMLVPGLHSIYGGVDLALSPSETGRSLSFAVSEVDARFRSVSIEVAGGGWNGGILAFGRAPPVSQPSMNDIAGRVSHDEFRSVHALIVGGSRGLGELTAKLIAAGGGKSVITYATGEDDALNVAREIRRWGASCEVLCYDINNAASGQLASLPQAPNQIYYYPSPPSAGRIRQKYSVERFENFCDYFVRGFRNLIDTADAAGWTFSAHYPSSINVEKPQSAMTEWTMAKASGEVLCADLARTMPRMRLIVSRLPALPTDQSASLMEMPTTDPIEVLLPILRDMTQNAL